MYYSWNKKYKSVITQSNHFYNGKLAFDFQRNQCQCPLSWAAHFYRISGRWTELLKECVNALYLGLLISTPPLKIPSIYAAFRAYFCRYFSEYSENFFKKVLKVGKRRIVFLRYNFLQFNNQSYFRDFTDGFPKLLCYTFILITIIKSIKKFDNKNNLYTHQSTGKSTL